MNTSVRPINSRSMRVQYYMKSKGGQTSEVFYIEGQGYKYIDGRYNKQ